MALNELQNVTTMISVPYNGPTSSEDIQDFSDSTVIDLAALAEQWNDTLAPLLNTLPGGHRFISADERSEYPNVFTNGIDAANLYIDNNAKPSDAYATFIYNSTNKRPSTIKETILSLKATVDTLTAPEDQTSSNAEYSAKTDYIPYLLSSGVSFDEFYLVNNVEVTGGTVTYPTSYPGVAKLSTGVTTGYVVAGSYIDSYLKTLFSLADSDFKESDIPAALGEWSFVSGGDASSYVGYAEGDFLIYLTSAPSATDIAALASILNNGTFTHTKFATAAGFTSVQTPTVEVYLDGDRLQRGTDFMVGEYSSLYKVIFPNGVLSGDPAEDTLRINFVSEDDTETIS